MVDIAVGRFVLEAHVWCVVGKLSLTRYQRGDANDSGAKNL